MQSEKIKIFGLDLLLTERKAFDVYEIADYSKSIKDDLGSIYGDALFVSAGLKFNYERLLLRPFIFGKEIKITLRLFKYFHLKKILSPEYLLKNLSRSETFEFIRKIWMMETGEDIKKKVLTPIREKQSAVSMQPE